MQNRLLLLTHARDDCANLVIRHFERWGTPFVRFNTETFHREIKVEMRLGASGKFHGRYLFSDQELDFENIAAVWNRRVHQPDADEELEDPELRVWMVDETFGALNISFTMLHCPIVNPWENNERVKFNKVLQMRRAAELGLEVPDTLITDRLETIPEFWEDVDQEMIFKKIRKGFFQFEDGRRLLVHTNKIPPESMTPENLRRMRFSPMFLQRHIPKRYDIRSVVVGDKVFSVAIHSQALDATKVDFRKATVLGILASLKHEPIDLGAETNQKLVAYTRSFGLAFGAIDLVLTPDDHLVFLEDNPNGQWGWLELFTGLNISGAFADYLIALASKSA